MTRIKNNIAYLFFENIKEWFSAKGFTIVLVLCFFTYSQEYYILEFASEHSCEVVPAMLPYLFGDMLFTMIFGLTVVYFFSDVPFIDDESFYSLLRLGRSRWAGLQIFRIILGSVLFMMLELVISIGVCIGHIEWGNEWGMVWNTLSVSQAADVGMFPRNIIVLYTPFTATVRVFFAGCLVLTFLGLLQFLLSLLINRIWSMIAVGILCVGPFIAYNWVYKKLYYISPLSWIGIIEHSSVCPYEGPDIQYMLFFLIGMLLIISILILIRINSINLYENREE